jgi:hypothetical protein
MGLLISRRQLAEELQVSLSRIQALIRRGMPVEPDGKIDLEFSCRWVLRNSSGDFADVKRALDALPEAERREVARSAWALSKRLVLLNEGAIHMLARQLYQTGRMNFRQILDLLQPVRRLRRRAAA